MCIRDSLHPARRQRLGGVAAGTRVQERQRRVGGIQTDPAGEVLGHGVHAVPGDGRPVQRLGLVLLEPVQQRAVTPREHAGTGVRVRGPDRAVRQPPRHQLRGPRVHPGDRRPHRAAPLVPQPQTVPLPGERHRVRHPADRSGDLPHHLPDTGHDVVQVLLDPPARQHRDVRAADGGGSRTTLFVERHGLGDRRPDVHTDDGAHACASRMSRGIPGRRLPPAGPVGRSRGCSTVPPARNGQTPPRTAGFARWNNSSPRRNRPTSAAVMAAARWAVCRVAPAR